MFLNSCLIKYRAIALEQLEKTKVENKQEIKYLTHILGKVNRRDAAYKYIAAMLFTRWVWGLVASGKQSKEKFHKVVEQVWRTMMDKPTFTPFHTDKCTRDGSPYSTICNTATQLLFDITNDNDMPSLDKVDLNHGLYKSLRQKYYLAPDEQPDKSHDNDLGVVPGAAQGSGAAAQGSSAAAQGSGAAAQGSAPSKKQNRLELERIKADFGLDGVPSEFLNDQHRDALSDIRFTRECFDRMDNFEEFQYFIKTENSYTMLPFYMDCDNEFKHGSPSWLACQIKRAFNLVKKGADVRSVIAEVRSLLRAHLDHDGYRNLYLSILASLNTDLSYHLNIEDMRMASENRRWARKKEIKDIFWSLEQIRHTKLVIDNGESKTTIRHHMEKLAGLNPANPTIQGYVNIAKGSVDDFVNNFNAHFNSEKLTQLSDATGNSSKTKKEEYRKHVREKAEKTLARVQRVVQKAREGLGSAPPRPPKRPSPDQEAAVRKRQKKMTLDHVRENIQHMRARLEAKKRELEEDEARLREQEARALQISREIDEMN